MYIPYQQEMEKLLQDFSSKVLHSYNLSVHAVDLAKEYQYSP